MTDPQTMQSEEEKKDEEMLARYAKIIEDNKSDILRIWRDIKKAQDEVLTDPIPFYENIVKLFFLISERSNGTITYESNDEILDIGYVLANKEWIDKVFFVEDSNKTRDFVEFARSISYFPGELGESDVFNRKLSPKGISYFDCQSSYVRDFFFVNAMFESFFINKKDGSSQKISDFSVKKDPDLEGEIYKKSVNLDGDYNLLKVFNYAVMDCVLQFIADLYVYVRRWKLGKLHKSHPDTLAVFLKAVDLFINDKGSSKTQLDKALELLEFANSGAKEGSDLRYYVNEFAKNLDDSLARFSFSPEKYSKLKRQVFFSTRNKGSLIRSLDKFKTSKTMGNLQSLKKLNHSNSVLQATCLSNEKFVDLIGVKVEENILALEKKRKLSKKRSIRLGLRNSEGKFRPYVTLKEQDESVPSIVKMQKSFEQASYKHSETLSDRAKAKIRRRVSKFFGNIFVLAKKANSSKKGRKKPTPLTEKEVERLLREEPVHDGGFPMAPRSKR